MVAEVEVETKPKPVKLSPVQALIVGLLLVGARGTRGAVDRGEDVRRAEGLARGESGRRWGSVGGRGGWRAFQLRGGRHCFFFLPVGGAREREGENRKEELLRLEREERGEIERREGFLFLSRSKETRKLVSS